MNMLLVCLWPSSTVPRSHRAVGRGRVVEDVDLRFGGNDFTYKKLFHLLIENCFITCHLLMETTIGRVPKFADTRTIVKELGLFIYSLRSLHWYPSHEQYLSRF